MAFSLGVSHEKGLRFMGIVYVLDVVVHMDVSGVAFVRAAVVEQRILADGREEEVPEVRQERLAVVPHVLVVLDEQLARTPDDSPCGVMDDAVRFGRTADRQGFELAAELIEAHATVLVDQPVAFESGTHAEGYELFQCVSLRAETGEAVAERPAAVLLLHADVADLHAVYAHLLLCIYGLAAPEP